KKSPPTGKEPAPPVRTVEEYPSAAQLPPRSCIHCHHVYEHRRQWLQTTNQWKIDEVWVYPLPENVGWTLAAAHGNRIAKVSGHAAHAGMKAGDLLQDVNGLPIASFADVQHALHKAPAAGTLPVKWTRDGKAMQATLTLGKDWKHTDVSWRH